MLIFRIDVDYAYASRAKSFLYTFFKKKHGGGYLHFAKLLANLLNSSNEEFVAYWFFTPYTTPDKEMLRLLDSERHVIGLHVVKDPDSELVLLESVVGKRVGLYTVHGTERLLAQIIWRRRLGEKQIIVPDDFRAHSFHVCPTYSLDEICYRFSPDRIIGNARKWVAEKNVMELHPEWLLNRGVINHRGPYVDVLKLLLNIL